MTLRRGQSVSCDSAVRVPDPGPGAVARSGTRGTPLLVRAYWKREWPLPFDAKALPFPVADPCHNKTAGGSKGPKQFWVQGAPKESMDERTR